MGRILLVDDEEHILQYYTEELTEEGHQVETLSSGEHVLSRIAFHQPEVVILDIRLVGYDGLEVLQRIRMVYPDLPVILSTAYDIFRFDPKALAADYYVLKSFDLSILKMAVQRAIEANSLAATSCAS